MQVLSQDEPVSAFSPDSALQSAEFPECEAEEGPAVRVLLKTRRTRQQEAIMRVLREADKPLDAIEVHGRALHLVAHVSRATVYRALQRLQDDGRVNCITPYNEAARYSLPGISHHRFCCRGCQRTFDLQVSTSSPCQVETALIDRSLTSSCDNVPASRGGFRVECHELRLHGLCPDCCA